MSLPVTYDYIVVGSGFFGSVFAREAASNGKSVLIIEKRAHIGGNSYSYCDEATGIDVHKYGTHIFHTNSQKIWDYVQRFASFNRYHHRVLTTYQNSVYSLPINLGTINRFYGINLRPCQVEGFLRSKVGNICSPQNLEEKAISLIGRDLYNAFIRGYTKKQWGIDPRELPASIITRLPVRSSYQDCYFDDIFQGVPLEGYGRLFEKLLAGIPAELGIDFLDDREYWRSRCKTLVYTGPIDEYFDNSLGSLSWRSERFEIERPTLEDFQGTSVMNYADEEVPWTRIHEPKHLHKERWGSFEGTLIMREYPCDNPLERYYPLNTIPDNQLFRRYDELAKGERNVLFGGRLAEYSYYDMHEAIGGALTAFQDHAKQ